MKKSLLMSMAAVAALSGAGIENAFSAGKAGGDIRAVYVDQDNELSEDTYTTAVGGILKYETASWNGITLGAGVYVSEKLGFASGSGDKLNYDVLSSKDGSYAYAGEAYIEYNANDFSLRIGRQLIDTPLADTDDIRMHPNTFEAAIASYGGIEGTTLVGGYVTRWAGYDSGDDISKFKKLAGDASNGAAVVGIVNESVENLAVQGWYYAIDELADAVYADATYAIPLSDTAGLELVGQFATFGEEKNSGLDGSVYGIGASVNVGMLTLGAAYNKASNDAGKFISNGFGGGPYLTSMEEWTIDGMEDAKAYQLRGEIDMGAAGIEGLTLTALYGVFKSAPLDMKLKERDFILSYRLSEAASMDVSYAEINDCNDNADGENDAGYSRFLARVSYNF